MKAIELTWPGGEHEFKLTIDYLRALQDKCDAGPHFILDRLSTRRWMVNDITETIRLALECGGLPKDEARRLVRHYVEDRPLTESVMTAQAILIAMLFGSEDDVPGEDQAGTVAPIQPRSPEESGDGPTSTDG